MWIRIRNTGGTFVLNCFAITSLDGEEGLLAEAVADVLVCDVRQLVVRDVVQDVLDALLGPLQSNINIQMRSSLVVRASDCQCRSRNSPGFDPRILRHCGI